VSSAPAGNPNGDGASPAPACDAFWQIGTTYDPYAKKGSASFTLMGKKSELRELRCSSLRNAEGGVVGYAVSFADATPKYSLYTEINFDDFKGDGVYSEDVYSSWRGDAGFAGYAVTLTVSENGKHGVAEDKDGDYRLEYDCDPSDDTKASAAAPLAEPVPGTAQVTGYRDAVYAFEGVECAYNSFSKGFDIMVPGVGTGEAYSFEVSLENATPGTQRADLWFDYYGIEDATGAQGSLTMTCGAAISGTFKEGSSAPGKPTTMKFACPIEAP
jgi:hypothetical protein